MQIPHYTTFTTVIIRIKVAIDSKQCKTYKHMFTIQEVLERTILPTFPLAMAAIVTLAKDCM
jgi:hypothetical protein